MTNNTKSGYLADITLPGSDWRYKETTQHHKEYNPDNHMNYLADTTLCIVKRVYQPDTRRKQVTKTTALVLW